MSLDRMHDYLAWPAYGLDACGLAAQAQVIRVIAMVAPKAGVEAGRGRGRERVLAAMAIRPLML
jgi:hypothetical protein